MALDAATLALCADELRGALADARIDKIHQPARDEVLLLMHSRTAARRLLIAARTGSARVCLTDEKYENPAVPPSFCMLLRKHLAGGRLVDVRCAPGDRILWLDFLCTNEMGDLVCNTLAAELMGRYCNIVLFRNGFGGASPAQMRPALLDGPAGEAARRAQGEAPRILDAMKRVDYEDSEIRQLLPGLPYTLPPMPPRPDFITAPMGEVMAALRAQAAPAGAALHRALGGVGPVVLREAAHRALGGAADLPVAELGPAHWAALEAAIGGIRADWAAGGRPMLVRRPSGEPCEFSFTALSQYLPGCKLEEYPDFSALLEGYYAEKDRAERLRQKSKQLHKTVQNLYERALRKQAARQEDLAASEKSEGLRTCGELLTANLYAFKKGDAAVTVQNWATGQSEVIRLDVRLSPSQNAQRYFREYKRRQTAAQKLAELLEAGRREIEYLGTVLYEVENAEGEAAVAEIREELKGQGYLRHSKHRDKRQKPADFLRYTSSEGFEILVGRNNAQNERLTLKTARGKDLWFHVKNAPGSHVVAMSRGQDLPPATRNEAAMLAVLHSSQKNGSKVPVDYTEVKNIRKTAGLPPGMVLYEHYETAYVTPDAGVIGGLGQPGGKGAGHG